MRHLPSRWPPRWPSRWPSRWPCVWWWGLLLLGLLGLLDTAALSAERGNTALSAERGNTALSAERGNTALGRPRLALVELIAQPTPIDPRTGVLTGLPEAFRPSHRFRLMGAAPTLELIHQWGKRPLRQAAWAQRLASLYDVQQLVRGRVHAIKDGKWVISFERLHPPRGGVVLPARFYSVLSEEDPVKGPVLVKLLSFFGFYLTGPSPRREEGEGFCKEGLSAEEIRTLIVDRILVVTERYYLRFRADGVREVSWDDEDQDERQRWRLRGKALCESLPGVREVACRCVRRGPDGGYFFQWSDGLRQRFRFYHTGRQSAPLR